jgi:threonine/homoserine/homoserine lactone efflux protein
LGQAIGEIIFHAVGVALSPFPLIAVVIVLAGPRSRANGVAFTLGFVVAVAAALAGLTAVFVTSRARTHNHASQWTMWVRVAIGILLIALAVHQFRRSRRGDPEPAPAAWLRKLEEFGPIRCVGLAAVLALADPKNISQLAAGALALAGDSGKTGERVVAGVVFVLLASLCVTVPAAVHLAGGDTAAATLNRWKDWMVRNDKAVIAVLLLILGAKSLGEGIGGLTS